MWGPCLFLHKVLYCEDKPFTDGRLWNHFYPAAIRLNSASKIISFCPFIRKKVFSLVIILTPSELMSRLTIIFFSSFCLNASKQMADYTDSQLMQDNYFYHFVTFHARILSNPTVMQSVNLYNNLVA